MFNVNRLRPHRWPRAPRRLHASRSLLIVLVISIVCLHAGNQQARTEPGRLELGVRLAPSLEKHAGERQFSENTYKSGVSAGGGLRYGLLDRLSVEAEVLFATRGSHVESDGETINGFNFRYLQLPALALYEFRIPGLDSDGGRSAVTGHVVAGPALSILVAAEDVDDRRPLPRSALSSFDVSVTVGLGLAWRMAPRRTASLELRFDRGFFDPFPGTDLDLDNQAILLTLGIDYALIHDDDYDDDGVIDSRDRCQTAAEDKKKPHVADGCPDADEDGLTDLDDHCRGEPEDPDGFQDEDGCPDPDNDGDGLLDAEDKCPTEAFSYNRELQHARRGCPPWPKRVRIEGDALVLDPPLVFEELRSTLTADHKRTLDQVAGLLLSYYPGMVLRVEGYADSEGDPQKNEARAEQRARVVADYLRRKSQEMDPTGTGIDLERLVEKGYGEAKPTHREPSNQSRLENRRVELVIIVFERQ
jgi:outer membrane protein OmpA-like peptidoglycan-associated protein